MRDQRWDKSRPGVYSFFCGRLLAAPLRQSGWPLRTSSREEERGSRTSVFDLRGDGPAAFARVVAHRGKLHGQDLLVMGANPGAEAGARRFVPLAKNPLARGPRNIGFLAGSGHWIECGRKL